MLTYNPRKMNKLILIGFIGIICLCGSTKAINKPSLSAADSSSNNAVTLLAPARSMNVIKINVSQLTSLKFEGQYERALGQKISIALGANLAASRNLPKQYTKSDPTGALASFKSTSWALTPELRWYPGSKKGAPNGFYIAPYAKFRKSNLESDVPYPYTDLNGQVITKTISMSGSYTGLGFGMLIGSQWIIGKHFSIDWYIAGGHVGPGKLNIEASSTGLMLSQADQDAIQQTIDQIDVPVVSDILNKVEINNNSVKLDTPFPYFGIRAAGINLGFAF